MPVDVGDPSSLAEVWLRVVGLDPDEERQAAQWLLGVEVHDGHSDLSGCGIDHTRDACLVRRSALLDLDRLVDERNGGILECGRQTLHVVDDLIGCERWLGDADATSVGSDGGLDGDGHIFEPPGSGTEAARSLNLYIFITAY